VPRDDTPASPTGPRPGLEFAQYDIEAGITALGSYKNLVPVTLGRLPIGISRKQEHFFQRASPGQEYFAQCGVIDPFEVVPPGIVYGVIIIEAVDEKAATIGGNERFYIK
jgi:hypothetical protein